MGLHKRAQIPFLSLWPSAETPLKTDRRLHLPPIAVLLLLLAILLSLLAFAQPVVHRPARKTVQLQAENPKITHAALRSGQLMLRFSGKLEKPIELTLEYDQTTQKQTLAPSNSNDFFLNFAAEPTELRIWLDQSVSTLKRQGARPKIQPQAPLGASAQRVIASYQEARKPTTDSPILKIATSLDTDESGVIPGKYEPADGALRVLDHPITAHVRSWPTSAGEAPENWTPLVQRGAKTLVAIRESQNVRQAWLAMDFSVWDTSPDFVIFWTNLLDYLAGPSPEYVFSKAVEKPQPPEKSKDIDLAPGFCTFACVLALLSSVLFYKKVQ